MPVASARWAWRGVRLDELKDEIKKTRDLTDKPFGVDLLAAVPESLEQAADAIIEGGAEAFISGLGVPPPHLVKKFHDAGLKVMNVSGTVRHAQAGEAGGLDAVVAQGTEAGGHTGPHRRPGADPAGRRCREDSGDRRGLDRRWARAGRGPGAGRAGRVDGHALHRLGRSPCRRACTSR